MIQIEESYPSFESCSDCIHSDDSEETCILRRCIHAVAQLKECYVPKQRKKGKWIDCASSEHWKCSACGKRAPFWIDWENSSAWDVDHSEWLSNFCPNCGAEMTEEKE